MREPTYDEVLDYVEYVVGAMEPDEAYFTADTSPNAAARTMRDLILCKLGEVRCIYNARSDAAGEES